MNERLIVIDHYGKPTSGAALGALYHYFTVPCDLVIVYVTAAPSVNDADLTIDINDDGSGAIEAVSCAVAATPGTWVSTHFGGTNAPVRVAADSVISLDLNNSANDTGIHVQIWALTSGVYS